MAAVYTGPVDEIRLSALGNGGETNKWDYIFAAAEEQLNLASDVIGRVTVELASGKGLNGCSFHLKNQDGEYNDLSLADVILVYVDSGSGNRKVFGGRIAEVRLLHTRYGRRYAEVKCVDHGIDLVAGDPLLKEYEGQTIKQMLQDLLEGYAVTDYGVDPDNELTDTYDMFFDWTPTWEAVRKICSLRECEWYVDKSGNFWVYPRGKYTSSITIDTGKILLAKRTIDYYGLRNMLYGLGGEVFEPLDGDLWTEDSNELTKWSISGVSGQTLTVSQSTESAVGSYSVKGECQQPSSPGPWNLIFTPESSMDLSAKWKHKPKRLEFWIKATENVGGQIRVRLEDPNLNIAEKYVQADSEWRKHTLTLGEDGEWHMIYGSFDWTKAQKIIFNCYYAVADETQAVWIDGLRFTGQKLMQTATDSTSQSAYGTRSKLVTADEIVSPEAMNDHLNRLLAIAKNGVQSLELTLNPQSIKAEKL